jgi:hypothetical protein
MRFELALGPSEENGPLLGEDTEFVDRLRKRSPQVIYVPTARVTHNIGPSRTELPWLFDRAFHLGRSVAAVGRKAHCDHSRSAFQSDSSVQSFQQRVERGGILNYYCGQIYQLRGLGDPSFDCQLVEALEQLEIRSNQDLLSEPASKVYKLLSRDGQPS